MLRSCAENDIVIINYVRRKRLVTEQFRYDPLWKTAFSMSPGHAEPCSTGSQVCRIERGLVLSNKLIL